MDCGPLCQAINEVTEGYHGKDFSHMGLVYIHNDSTYIIEASGKAVKMTPLNVFSRYTNSPMYVGRLKENTENTFQKPLLFH